MAYPNFPDKHALDSIAEPAAVHRYWVDHGVLPAEHEAPDGVILLYQAPLTDAVLAGRLGPVSPFAPGAICGFGVGAPAATIIMEMLGVLGVRRFVGVGTADALQPDLDTGAVLVCDRAVRDEVASAFTVSDSLAGGEWSPQFNDPRVAASLARMVHAAVATLRGAQG